MTRPTQEAAASQGEDDRGPPAGRGASSASWPWTTPRIRRRRRRAAISALVARPPSFNRRRPALRDAVLKAPAGTISQVKRRPGTYTIVLVVAKEPAGQRDLSSPGVRGKRDGHAGASGSNSCCRRRSWRSVRSDAKVVNQLAAQIIAKARAAGHAGTGPRPARSSGGSRQTQAHAFRPRCSSLPSTGSSSSATSSSSRSSASSRGRHVQKTGDFFSGTAQVRAVADDRAELWASARMRRCRWRSPAPSMRPARPPVWYQWKKPVHHAVLLDHGPGLPPHPADDDGGVHRRPVRPRG